MLCIYSFLPYTTIGETTAVLGDYEMLEVSRNDAIEIARRTERNLRFVKSEFDREGEESPVHVVTQLVNSLLGLVILPREQYLEVQYESTKWRELAAEGWPEWNITKGKADTLGQLIWHVRNAAAHGRIAFSSDSRYLHEVMITVEDSRDKGKSIYWRAEIKGDDLYEFCLRFAKHVRGTIG